MELYDLVVYKYLIDSESTLKLYLNMLVTFMMFIKEFYLNIER